MTFELPVLFLDTNEYDSRSLIIEIEMGTALSLPIRLGLGRITTSGRAVKSEQGRITTTGSKNTYRKNGGALTFCAHTAVPRHKINA